MEKIKVLLPDNLPDEVKKTDDLLKFLFAIDLNFKEIPPNAHLKIMELLRKISTSGTSYPYIATPYINLKNVIKLVRVDTDPHYIDKTGIPSAFSKKPLEIPNFGIFEEESYRHPDKFIDLLLKLKLRTIPDRKTGLTMLSFAGTKHHSLVMGEPSRSYLQTIIPRLVLKRPIEPLVKLFINK